MKGIVFPILGVAVLICAGACSIDSDRVAVVEQGEFHAVLTETGELQTVRSKVVPMPAFDWSYGRPQIVELEKEGIIVKKGHVVARLDTSGVVRVLGQKTADLEIAQADLEKLRVENGSQMKKLEAELQSAQAALLQAQIDTQRVKFESEAKKEVNQLKLKIAEISFQKAKKNIEHTRTIQREAILIQRARIKQTQSEIDKAKRTIESFTLRAPAEGMVVYRKKRRERVKIAVGDQLYPGEPMIGLPDLSQIKVLTSVNEIDIEKVRAGQKAIVRLDAFPKITFDGAVTMVSRICHEKDKDSKIKVFDVEVLLNKSARILRPGMTVSCEILVAELEDALFVDNACIREEDGEYFVYVKDGSRKKPVKVKLGPRNNKSVVVYGNLKAGDEVVEIQKLTAAL
jgi:multidrug efflux pump subunit AcrA (membrane-fusion protein)